MEYSRFSILVLVVIIMLSITTTACSFIQNDNTADNTSSLSIVISHPAGEVTISPGEELAVTSTSISDAGVSQVMLLINGQVVATSSPQEPAAQMFVAVTSWVPGDPGTYKLSVAVEDVNNQRVETEKMTINVGEQADGQASAPTSASVPATSTSPPPTSTSLPPTDSPTAEPTSTSGSGFGISPIIISPTPNPTSGFTFSPIPITIIPSGPPSIHFEISEMVIGPKGRGTTTAVCPEGSLVVGGGFHSLDYVNNIEMSHFNQPLNGWTITAKHYDNSTQKVTAVAACLSNSGGTIKTQNKTVTVPANSEKVISIPCPAGSVVTGGGWTIQQGSFVMDSQQAGNGWVLRVDNGNDSSRQADINVQCLSGTNASSHYFTESTSVGGESSKSIYAYCGPGQLVTGGGFYRELATKFSSPVGPNATGPKYGWGTGTYNPAVKVSKDLKVSATCLSFP